MHFGQQRPALRHADERPLLLVVADLVLGIVCRHPDDATVATSHIDHVAHGLRVDAANRGIECHRTEHVVAWRRVLADQIRETGGLGPVILQHDPAQAALLRQLRDLEGIGIPRIAVGIVMRMQVDGADDRRIGQMLIGLRHGRLVLVGFPVGLRSLRCLPRRERERGERAGGQAGAQHQEHIHNASLHAAYYVSCRGEQ